MFVHQEEIFKHPDNHLFDEGIAFCRKGRFDKAYQCFKRHLSLNSFCQESIQMLSYCRYKFSENCRRNVSDSFTINEPLELSQNITKSTKKVTKASQSSSSQSLSDSKSLALKKKSSKAKYSNCDNINRNPRRSLEIQNEDSAYHSKGACQPFLLSPSRDQKLNRSFHRNFVSSKKQEKPFSDTEALLQQAINHQQRIESFLLDIDRTLSKVEMEIHRLHAKNRQVESKISRILLWTSRDSRFLDSPRVASFFPLDRQFSSMHNNEKLNDLSCESNFTLRSAAGMNQQKITDVNSEQSSNHFSRMKCDSTVKTSSKENSKALNHEASIQNARDPGFLTLETPFRERNPNLRCLSSKRKIKLKSGVIETVFKNGNDSVMQRFLCSEKFQSESRNMQFLSDSVDAPSNVTEKTDCKVCKVYQAFKAPSYLNLDSSCTENNFGVKILAAPETTNQSRHNFSSCEANTSKDSIPTSTSMGESFSQSLHKDHQVSCSKIKFSTKRKLALSETYSSESPKRKLRCVVRPSKSKFKRSSRAEEKLSKSKRPKLFLSHHNLATLNKKMIGLVKEPQLNLSILTDHTASVWTFGRSAHKNSLRRPTGVRRSSKQSTLISVKSSASTTSISAKIDDDLQHLTGPDPSRCSTLVVSPPHCNTIVPYSFNRKEVSNALFYSNSACMLNCLNLFVDQICSVIKDSLSLIPSDYFPLDLRLNSGSNSVRVTSPIKYLPFPKNSLHFGKDFVIRLLTRGHYIEFSSTHVYQVDPFWFSRSSRCINSSEMTTHLNLCLNSPGSQNAFPFVYPVEILLHSLCTDLYNYTLITGPFRIRFINFTKYFVGKPSSSNCDN